MATAVPAPSVDPDVSAFVSAKQKLLINGKWVEAASGKTFPSYNPATGKVLANVAEGDRPVVKDVSCAARQADLETCGPDRKT
jgi:phenylacetaldehyde dehydrogenase